MDVSQPAVHPWVAVGERQVRFGLYLGPLSRRGATSLEWAEMAEELGFDSFWLRDHPARAPEDAWTYLAALAARTHRIRLGTLVTCASYRPAVLLARMAADVDRLSRGRLVLGLGAGWDATEFSALGLPFPSLGERLRILEGVIQGVRAFWRERGIRGDGPVQTPHVPLLLGGGGRSTLRLVAEHADAANLGPGAADGAAATPEALVARYAVLRERCAAVGRPPQTVLRTYLSIPVVLAANPSAARAKRDALQERVRSYPGLLVGTPREALTHYRRFLAAGVRYFIVGVEDAETARLLAAEVAPALAA